MVAPETVLRELSKPADELPDPARRALETDDSVTVRVSVEQLNRRERRPAHFVAANDSYDFLRTTYVAHDGIESPLETLAKILLFALGVRFLLVGQSRRLNLGDPPF